MKNVAIINTCDYGSTGKIALGLYDYMTKANYNVYFFYGRGKKRDNAHCVLFEQKAEVCFHAVWARISGYQGSASIHATKKLIYFLDKLAIDTIYCINLHGYYLNEKILFEYIGKKKIRLIYIMADEYPYLGKCTNTCDCDKYMSSCHKCQAVHAYPKSMFFDRSHKIFEMKKKAYDSIEKCAFIGPTYVIHNARKSALLRNRKLYVLDEAIDLQVFSPRETRKIRFELGIDEKKIVILCVAPSDNESKGCRYFVELARRFENNSKYVFVHVAYVGNKADLPSNYIAIGYERNQDRLAEYYSLGDLFVFPSLLDTMPNACLESLACGTPILCFDTSGMPFVADDETGIFVDVGSVEQLERVVSQMVKKDQKMIEKCRSYAENRYDRRKYFQELIRIGNDF